MNFRRELMIVLIFSIQIFHCTHNPFFEDKIGETDGSSLTGSVTLSDGETPDRIYVWLDGVNAGTYSDIGGQFKLIIPTPPVQPGGGISGEYKLYYYNGNYKIHYLNVFFIEGVVKYDQADVDVNGKMKDVVLQKLTDLIVTIEPESYYINTGGDFWLEYTFTNVSEPTPVEFYTRPGDRTGIANIFFLPLNAPIEKAILYKITDSKTSSSVRNTTTRLLTEKTYNFNLPMGQYQVIPYLHIPQENLPDPLIKSLGGETDTLTYRFLNIPYKRKLPTLGVLPR